MSDIGYRIVQTTGGKHYVDEVVDRFWDYNEAVRTAREIAENASESYEQEYGEDTYIASGSDEFEVRVSYDGTLVLAVEVVEFECA